LYSSANAPARVHLSMDVSRKYGKEFKESDSEVLGTPPFHKVLKLISKGQSQDNRALHQRRVTTGTGSGAFGNVFLHLVSELVQGSPFL
jgi:hypothetical protein